MKVLYLHQYFVTPSEYGSTRSYWFAKKLLEAGHSVTIITSTRDKTRKPGRFDIEGIDVIYVNSPYNNLMSPLAKVWTFLRFMAVATWYVVREKRVDVIYATSTPLSIGVVALLGKCIRGYKYIFEVRDLWPEFPIQIGAIRNKVVIWLLRVMERAIYQYAEFIVALSPGMREGVISTGVSADKVAVLPNMSKPDIFYARPKNASVADKHGIDLSKFNVVHFGSMGVANGLEYIVEAARILRDRGDTSVVFYLVGYGKTEQMLRDMVTDYGLRNVRFLGKQSAAFTSEIVNCCSATITSFKELPILETNSPNKFFDSLSAGKPVIVNFGGWIKELVEIHRCGFYVSGSDPSSLVEKLLAVKDNEKLLEEYGDNARKLCLTFDKHVIATQFLRIVERYGA